ncbi:iron uptake transporter deferrochelatase/peroxidase subunit [Jatrophihabitans sp.]|uniref:iron uptake transporter deferrochelatase/peroxidase subunit n=1 Tax=Jatrophihabitans sp. TaxID=1932789 RepID=UPI002C8F0143|nr:iron uptake transporter deferrochelatase/peroxidase subunit [Jatrophihabitans sp.]
MSAGFSRRSFLAGAFGTVAAAGGAAALAGCDSSSHAAATRPAVVPFRGAHQAGIATPAQDRLAFAAFDVTSTSRSELVDLLRRWTVAAEKMTRGEPVGAVEGAEQYVPADTGEATGLPAANLTVTIGFGPSLFDHRFGLAGRRPAALRELPAFPGDALDPRISGGDICIQACADDPQVAFHAVRNLNRIGFGVTAMRWFQLGFGRTSSTTPAQQTPRNLMGFKDGTRNVNGEVAADLDSHVWVGKDTDQAWLAGGSYLVSRKIRMGIEAWDRDRIGDQEAVFGRTKVEGAPLTGRHERDEPDLAAKAADGTPVIAADAHIRLAAPESNGGVKILRRGYSFTDGVDPVTGQLNAGLFFICFQSDPATGFIPVQRNLATDALNEYIKHTSSALFACPPGPADGQFWGQALFS